MNWQDARLHFGCGAHPIAGWVNADGMNGPGVDVVFDFHDGLRQIPSESLKWIYTSHVIEHLFPNLLPEVLAQLHRTLQPGGKLTIATTDIEGIMKHWFPVGPSGERWEDPLFGRTGSMFHPFEAHRDAFTYGKLKKLLHAAGFPAVQQWSPSQYPEIAALGDFSVSCAVVTCYAEAIK